MAHAASASQFPTQTCPVPGRIPWGSVMFHVEHRHRAAHRLPIPAGLLLRGPANAHSDINAPGWSIAAPHTPPPRMGVHSNNPAAFDKRCILYHLGLRPKPPASASGDPFAPRRACRGPPCGPGDDCFSARRPPTTWGCAPNPQQALAGTPLPRAALAGARRAGLGTTASVLVVRLPLGAAPQNPQQALAGTPLPRAALAGARRAGLGTTASVLVVRLPLGAAPQTPGKR